MASVCVHSANTCILFCIKGQKYKHLIIIDKVKRAIEANFNINIQIVQAVKVILETNFWDHIIGTKIHFKKQNKIYCQCKTKLWFLFVVYLKGLLYSKVCVFVRLCVLAFCSFANKYYVIISLMLPAEEVVTPRRHSVPLCLRKSLVSCSRRHHHHHHSNLFICFIGRAAMTVTQAGRKVPWEGSLGISHTARRSLSAASIRIQTLPANLQLNPPQPDSL